MFIFPPIGRFTLFCRKIFLSQIFALFWRTFFRPKKYGDVQRMTNIRCGADALAYSSAVLNSSAVVGARGLGVVSFQIVCVLVMV